jgi:hypothetical protein
MFITLIFALNLTLILVTVVGAAGFTSHAYAAEPCGNKPAKHG